MGIEAICISDQLDLSMADPSQTQSMKNVSQSTAEEQLLRMLSSLWKSKPFWCTEQNSELVSQPC